MSQADLDKLRQKIDRIDDSIHDLLMERAGIVEDVRTAKGEDGIKLRPGREAMILRRLMDRHSGTFPKAGLVRIWREVMSAYLRLQGPLSMAVYMPEGGEGYWDLARDQYGSQTPMSAFSTVRGVLTAVQDKEAAIGILPVPKINDEDPWWRHLAFDTPTTPRILARLPVARTDDVHGSHMEALVIGQPSEDHTDQERYYTVAEYAEETGPRRIVSVLEDTGIDGTIAGFWTDNAGPHFSVALLETQDRLAKGSNLAEKLLQTGEIRPTRLIELGGYAVQFEAEDLV